MPYYYFHRHLLYFREGNKIIWVALFSPVTGGRCERVSLSLFRPPPFLLEFSFLGQFWRGLLPLRSIFGKCLRGQREGGWRKRMGSHGDGNWQKLAVKFLQSRFVKGGGGSSKRHRIAKKQVREVVLLRMWLFLSSSPTGKRSH